MELLPGLTARMGARDRTGLCQLHSGIGPKWGSPKLEICDLGLGAEGSCALGQKNPSPGPGVQQGMGLTGFTHMWWGEATCGSAKAKEEQAPRSSPCLSRWPHSGAPGEELLRGPVSRLSVLSPATGGLSPAAQHQHPQPGSRQGPWLNMWRPHCNLLPLRGAGEPPGTLGAQGQG